MELSKGGRVFQIHDSVKLIPARRLLGFQLHLMQHHACGSTFEEVDANCHRIDELYEAGRLADARQARQNQRMGFWLMFAGINTATVALAHLVKSVDGEPVDVSTDEQMLAVARLLEATDITQQEVEDILERVKKKLDDELQRYVPELFNERLDMEHAGEVVEEARLALLCAREPTEARLKALAEVRGRLLDARRPMCFDLDSEHNYQVKAERDFVSLCALLLREGVAEPAERPALEFWLHVQLLKEKNKPRSASAPRWDGQIND